MYDRAIGVARELAQGPLRVEPGMRKLVGAWRELRRAWQTVSDIVDRVGSTELAALTRRYVDQVPPPFTERNIGRLSYRYASGSRRRKPQCIRGDEGAVYTVLQPTSISASNIDCHSTKACEFDSIGRFGGGSGFQ